MIAPAGKSTIAESTRLAGAACFARNPAPADIVVYRT